MGHRTDKHCYILKKKTIGWKLSLHEVILYIVLIKNPWVFCACDIYIGIIWECSGLHVICEFLCNNDAVVSLYLHVLPVYKATAWRFLLIIAGLPGRGLITILLRLEKIAHHSHTNLNFLLFFWEQIRSCFLKIISHKLLYNI